MRQLLEPARPRAQELARLQAIETWDQVAAKMTANIHE
jgi:hypothetical protein